jgi:hypothetical protein
MRFPNWPPLKLISESIAAFKRFRDFSGQSTPNIDIGKPHLPVSAGKKWGFSFRVKEMGLETVRKA